MLSPLTAVRVFNSWTLDLPVVLLGIAISAAYLWGVRRRSEWPRRRTALFLGGVGLCVVITCSVLGVYAHTLSWALAVQDVLLLTLAPLPLVLGRPLDVLPRRRRRRGMPPALAAFGCLVALLSLYVTGLDQLRLEHQSRWSPASSG